MFDTHLRHSGNAPLTLVLRWNIVTDSTFSTDENHPSDPLLPINALMQKAVERQHRWYDVVIEMHSSTAASFAPTNFSIRLGEMEMLKNLSVADLKRFTNTTIEAAPCPNLETLVKGQIDIVVSNSDDSSLKTPVFPKLTFVSVCARYPKEFPSCWELLKLSSHVECMDLEVYDDFGGDPLVPVIELPRLRKLSLSMEPDDAIVILERFSLPSLNSLNLGTSLCDDPDATLINLANTLKVFHVFDLTFS